MADIPFRPVETGTQPVQPLRPVHKEQNPKSSHKKKPEPKKDDAGHQVDEFA
ncbi:hypothetical protein [Acidithiobacillus marinus]|uniref:hypothetical protein n=1 Tax=Acidithiobacillus marinus TaxID=187490 RepID=UPI001555A357|nr:hypothetical protein [Acidithiobacillus marinus]